MVEKLGAWRKWMTLLVVCLAIFMDALDVSIVNTALPDIQRELNLTTTTLQWVQGAYVLTYAGFLLLGGRTADLLGRRRIFLAGTAVFGIASQIGGMANTGWLLLATRTLKGIGAAFTLPAAVSIITTTFAEGPERNKALGTFAATAATGFSFGLILGGVLTDFFSWHWVFFVNVPFVVLILVLTPLLVSEEPSNVSRRSYDFPGAITVTSGLLLLVYAITQANEPGVTLRQTGGLFIFALCLLAIFVVIERSVRDPLLPLRIFRSNVVRSANLVSLTLLGSFFSFMFITTLYMQNIINYTPLWAGLALLPMSIVSALVSQFVAPWLLNKFGLRIAVVLGTLCLAIGVALFIRISPVADYVGVILPASLMAGGLGMGIAYPTLAIAGVTGVVEEEQGLAAGLQSTSLQAGGGLGLAIVVAAISARTSIIMGSGTSATPTIGAQISGFQMGLLVAAGFAVLGALIALLGIRQRPVLLRS